MSLLKSFFFKMQHEVSKELTAPCVLKWYNSFDIMNLCTNLLCDVDKMFPKHVLVQW